MHIVITGIGYVGLITAVCLADVGFNVTCVDINENKINLLKHSKPIIYEEGLQGMLIKHKKMLRFTTNYEKAYKDADVIFIAVDTRQNMDGSTDMSKVDIVVENIAQIVRHDCIVIIKSTVTVGTNKRVKQYFEEIAKGNYKIKVVSNPEFMSQGSAIGDTLSASRIILGYDDESCTETLHNLFKPFAVPIYETDPQSSEMIKYASNCFLALKISYMNNIANLCEKVGANVEYVREGMSYDKRIGRQFLNAGIGYGGSCLPKDTRAFSWLAKSNDCSFETLDAAISVNEKQIISLYVKAKQKYLSFVGVKISVLGLTFKPNTDDVRESPALVNIRLLLKDGAYIKVFDPVGMQNAKYILPNNDHIQYCHDIYEALLGTQICFIFTEWESIKNIEPSIFVDSMVKAVIYDGRNCFNPQLMHTYNIEYSSIGR